jgi:hypothetical protein
MERTLLSPEEIKQRRYENARQDRRENPEKYKARNMVSNAVRDGKLFKQPCEVCESTWKIQAHHDDYSKPLEVHWLCPRHHSEVTMAAVRYDRIAV